MQILYIQILCLPLVDNQLENIDDTFMTECILCPFLKRGRIIAYRCPSVCPYVCKHSFMHYNQLPFRIFLCKFLGICIKSGQHFASKNNCSPILSFEVMPL